MKLNLPKTWNDVSVEQYIELRELEKSEHDSFIDSDLETLAILSNIATEEFEDLTLNEVGAYMDQLIWLRAEPPKKVKKIISRKKYMGLSSLTLGEYIELDSLFTDFITNFTLIAAVMYRQYKTNEWGETIIEPYEYDPAARENTFLDLKVTEIYGIVPEFLDYKKNFMEVYKPLFNPDLSDEDIESLSEEEKREIEQDEANEKWSWERLIYTLCDGDLTKADSVLNLNLTFVFNMLGMKKAFNL